MGGRREERDGASATGLEGLGRGRILVGGAAFLALTAGALWWQLGLAPASGAPSAAPLRWPYLALILLLLPVESAAAALRLWLLCRVLQPGVSLRTCLQAEWANAAVSLLTPSQSGGGAGQVYLLTRGGARAATALSASVLSFVGTLAGLLVLGLYTALVSDASRGSGRLFATAGWSLAAAAALLGLAAARPDRLRAGLGALSRAGCRLAGRPDALREWRPPASAGAGRAVDRMDRLSGRLADLAYAYRDHVGLLLRRGKATLAAVVALSLVFLAARALAPFLCARFLGVPGLALRPVLEAQAALIFLVFFAPTPGGAGIAEGASLALMADLVPAAYATRYTLLWRAVTVYVAALAGFACLARALARDARALAGRPRGARTGARGETP